MSSKIYKLILVRHGESEANLAKSKSYDHIGGQTESPLSLLGKEQADNLKKLPLISHTEGSIIYSSPSNRSIETAVRATECTLEDIIIDAQLSERSLGEVEGLSLEEVKNNPAYSSYFLDNNGYEFRHSFTNKLPGGESYMDVVNRTRSWFDKCMAEIPEDTHTIKVFSHIITMRCLLHWMLKMPEERTLNLWIDNADPIILICDKDGQNQLISKLNQS